jgi:transcriptional regulator with XRE-family HTH domain
VEIWPNSASFEAVRVLLSAAVDTNAALRQRVWRLVHLGINQKVLASKMGLSESQLSKWLRKRISKPVPVTALDGFNRYIEALRAEADLDPLTLSPDELEQFDSETLTRETAHAIQKQTVATSRRSMPAKGKSIATK